MPIRTSRFLRAVLPALCALLVTAAPARATGLTTCPAQPLAQIFLPWGDPAWYEALPNAGFEAPGTWTLQGGAEVVAGNERFHVGAPTDSHSLSLPTGSTALSGWTCVGAGHPTLRFFVRNTGSADANLTVLVDFRTVSGVFGETTIGVVAAGAAWAPAPVVPVVANLLSPLSAQQVAFRFQPADSRGHWAIDDVYVDPYGKG